MFWLERALRKANIWYMKFPFVPMLRDTLSEIYLFAHNVFASWPIFIIYKTQNLNQNVSKWYLCVPAFLLKWDFGHVVWKITYWAFSSVMNSSLKWAASPPIFHTKSQLYPNSWRISFQDAVHAKNILIHNTWMGHPLSL